MFTLLAYPLLSNSFQWPEDFDFEESKAGSGMKILFSLAHLADSDMIGFPLQMGCSSLASSFREPGLLVYTFV